VIGYSVTSYIDSQPVIGFDMGGTSTDVSRFDGSLDHVLESTLASVTIQAPQLDINTVAAGGGSILTFRSGLFRVGPESAGAQPGPACYKKGGPLTVTDANLILGRLIAEHFPSLFGPNGNEPLDPEASTTKFKELSETVEFLFVEFNN
jgi:5-oxoprolinase (ATP-hydrolysing)